MAMRWYKFVSILVVCSMIVSAFGLLISSSGDEASSISSWNPFPSPTGKREAVYKFDHWGETYLKNEKWNMTDYPSYPGLAGISIQDLGHHGIFLPNSTRLHDNPTGMGVSDWLNSSKGVPVRQPMWGEYGIRTSRYPFIFASNPNSPETHLGNASSKIDYIIWIPYRITGMVKNETMARTGYGGSAAPGAGGHAWRAFYVPHLGPGSWTLRSGLSGGYINCSYYGTYLTESENNIIENPHPSDPRSVHYAQWFYGASAGFFSYSNDGYQYELQGRIRYSVDAAMAYLGYPGLGTNIITWWNTNVGSITNAWKKDWVLNGSYDWSASQQNSSYRGLNSIFTNYMYDMNNSGLFSLCLKIDKGNSSYTGGRAGTYITIRLYSVSYGLDSLMTRLMERSNCTGWWANNSAGRNIRGSDIDDYHEDMYWNITAGPRTADMFFRQVTTYRCTAWEDPSSSVFMGGWMLETFHSDKIGNGQGYVTPGKYWSYPSPFDRYDPDMQTALSMNLNLYSTISKVPGTRRYQKNATYWTTPVTRNFSKYECFIYDLNTSHYWGTAGRDFIGINPTWTADPNWGAANQTYLSDNYAKGNFTKAMYWGRLKLGDYCTPYPIVKTWHTQTPSSPNAYNNLTGVLNISGGSGTGLPRVGIYMDAYLKSGRDYWQGYSTTFGAPNGKGTLNYEKNLLGMGNRILAHGTPFIMLDVVPVDDYQIKMPFTILGTNHIKVSAVNGTGKVVTNMWNYASGKVGAQQEFAWNGTVVLQLTPGTSGAVFTMNASQSRLTTNYVWGAGLFTAVNFTQSANGIVWADMTCSGPGAITVTARDSSNHSATSYPMNSFSEMQTAATTTVVILGGPYCTITTPTFSTTFVSSTPYTAMRGIAFGEIGVTSVTWSNSLGGSGTATGTTDWTIPSIALSAGINVINVTAHDSEGIWIPASSKQTDIVYDITPPTVAITTPASNPYYTNSAFVSMSGTSSDNFVVATVTWKNMRTGSSGTCTGTTGWSQSVPVNTSGNLIYINATDLAGNIASTSMTVILDNTPPACTITDPTAGPTMTTAWHMILLKGNATDNLKVTSIVWSNSLGGSGIAYMTPQWGASSVNWQSRGNVMLYEGDNVITATAYDASGNSATDTLTVTYQPPESVPPTVTITNPTSSPTMVTGWHMIYLMGTATDNLKVTSVTWTNSLGGSGIAYMVPQFGGASITWQSRGNVNLLHGNNVITVTASDSNGNIATDVLTVTYTGY